MQTRRRDVGDGEGTRQVGATALSRPALGGEHVELPRVRLRPLLVAHRDDPIPARRAVCGDLAKPPPKRCAHRASAVLAIPWISCSERTSASPAILAAIARAAAEAPVIVVTQGISWRTAAVRIS